ncbi:hypothetical protein D3C81_2006390 [compost metagenome]
MVLEPPASPPPLPMLRLMSGIGSAAKAMDEKAKPAKQNKTSKASIFLFMISHPADHVGFGGPR